MDGNGNNLSMGGNMSLSYTLLKVHSFSFMTSYNRYVNSNIVEEQYLPQQRSHDIMCSLSYNYTFSALSIKRQTEEAMKGDKKKYIITSDFTKKKSSEEKRKMGGPRL